MKKFAFAILAALLIGGCGFLPTSINANPTADVSMPTQVPPSETPTALPSPTAVPATETPIPTLESSATPPPAENLTTTPATATSGALAVSTATQSLPSGSATVTPTLGVLTYGTLPPAVPSNKVTLANRSKAQAYISLQQQEKNGAILEYPVKTRFTIRAPIGHYIYVAWVGGRKMTGSFNLNASSEIVIILYKDKVVVQHP